MNEIIDDFPDPKDKDFEKNELVFRRGFHHGVAFVLHGLELIPHIVTYKLLDELKSYERKIYSWRRLCFKKRGKKTLLKKFWPKRFENIIKEKYLEKKLKKGKVVPDDSN